MEFPDMDDFPRPMRTLDARHLTTLFPNMADLLTNLVEDEPKENKPKENKPNQDNNYAVRKRQPLKPLEGDNVIYVTKKTNFKAQLEKCSEILTRGEKEVILHGLGTAIQRCCNLAIQLQSSFSGTHDIEINTDTVDVIDDLIPMVEDLEFDTQYRYQSAIHIRIFRTAVMGANQ